MGLWLIIKEKYRGGLGAQSLRGHLTAFFCGLILLLGPSVPVFAAHPLITDDTSTQGQGKFQLEVNGEYSHDHDGDTTEDLFEIGTIISYGLMDALDLVVGSPLPTREDKGTGAPKTPRGGSRMYQWKSNGGFSRSQAGAWPSSQG